METRVSESGQSLESATLPSGPESPATSAASLLGTVTLLVNDTQVDVTRLIYMLYLDIEQQINRADLKAQITLSTSAILIGVMVNLGVGFKFSEPAALVPHEWIALIFHGVFILAMCLAFGRGIAAAFPRAVRKAAGANHHPNLYFSGQIVSIRADDYAELFCRQSNDAVKRSVLGQIHSKSIVLEAKLRNVRLGMICLLIALAAWVLGRAVLVLGNLGTDPGTMPSL
jgi:hypothetical protein